MTAENEKIFFDNLGLVRMVARKYVGKTLSMTYDDLYQTGCIGLVKAIDEYDENLGYQFSTFAAKCIRNEILMTIERTDRPVYLHPVLQKMLRDYKREKAETGISLEEYAEKNNYKKYGFIQGYLTTKGFYSLDNPIPINNGSENEDIFLYEILPGDSIPFEVTEYYEELLSDVNSMVNRLEKDPKIKKRDADILKAWIGIGEKRKTLREIADKYGVTYQRIQQITDKLLGKLRKEYPEAIRHLEICDMYDLNKFENDTTYEQQEGYEL